MTPLTMCRAAVLAMAAALSGGLAAPAAAQSVMQQCGQQYQAAKAANTLNGMSWPQYRSACAARLKGEPAAAAAAPIPAAVPANPLKPAVAPAPATTAVAAPAAPAPAAPAPAAPVPAGPASAAPATTAEGKPMSPGRAAFVTRERQCGSEWKANKVSLKAQTPGLTWPKYLSQCNTRLKAAGQ